MSPLFSWVAKVPEIISSIRQAGKIARQEELRCPSEFDDTFAKKFEVLFCGRVTVAHKKAPPALIDECIEKFNHVSCGRRDWDAPTGQPSAPGARPMRKSFSQPGLRSLAFRKEFQDTSLRSSTFSSFDNDIENHLIGGHNVVQPTDMEENRTMLFTIGQSEVYLISPDTKKIAVEKNFKEISFCSQGIRHVDHFGFICRECSGGGGFHFVCYVFQCTNEALVDEIMMTLKQAFTVAAVQQTAKAPAQLCEGCPLQGLHKLCERIEGMNSSKTKLELQKHLTTLTNQEQATIFEEVQKLRPRNEQRENELIISFLRCLYEEKQKEHNHIGEPKQYLLGNWSGDFEKLMQELRLSIVHVNSTRVDISVAEGLSAWITQAMNHLKEWAGMGALGGMLILVSFIALWCICRMRVTQQRSNTMIAQAFSLVKEWDGVGVMFSMMLLAIFVCLWCLCRIRKSQKSQAAMLVQAFAAVEAGQSPQAWLSMLTDK